MFTTQSALHVNNVATGNTHQTTEVVFNYYVSTFGKVWEQTKDTGYVYPVWGGGIKQNVYV